MGASETRSRHFQRSDGDCGLGSIGQAFSVNHLVGDGMGVKGSGGCRTATGVVAAQFRTIATPATGNSGPPTMNCASFDVGNVTAVGP
jgi:hypothetical protein